MGKGDEYYMYKKNKNKNQKEFIESSSSFVSVAVTKCPDKKSFIGEILLAHNSITLGEVLAAGPWDS